MNLNMKILDKITLVLFSVIILVISILIALLMFGWVKFSTITIFYGEIIANNIATNTLIVSSIVCALLALRAIFFNSNTGTSSEGVLLENDAGKLLISRDTIENLVNSIARGFENTQSVTTKVLINDDNELKLYITLIVLPDTVISELSMNLQARIKETIKTAAGIDVKTINIRVKNIMEPIEKTES